MRRLVTTGLCAAAALAATSASAKVTFLAQGTLGGTADASGLS